MKIIKRLVYFYMVLFCGLTVNYLGALVTPPVTQIQSEVSASKVILNGFQCSAGSDCIILQDDAEYMISKLIERKISIGDDVWLRDFVKRNGVGWRDESGKYLLHYAVISNKFQLVKLLVDEFKHPIKVFDQFGMTPLDYSVDIIFEYLMDEFITRLSPLFCDYPWDCDALSKEALLLVACMHASDKYIKMLTDLPYNTEINDVMFDRFTIAYSLIQDRAKRDKLRETHSYLSAKYNEQKKNKYLCNIL